MDVNYKEPNVNLNKIKDMILWDFKLENETFNCEERPRGFALVIDAFDRNLELALYKLTPMLSSTQKIMKQPPREILEQAIIEQGCDPNVDNLYNVNNKVIDWVKENLM